MISVVSLLLDVRYKTRVLSCDIVWLHLPVENQTSLQFGSHTFSVDNLVYHKISFKRHCVSETGLKALILHLFTEWEIIQLQCHPSSWFNLLFSLKLYTVIGIQKGLSEKDCYHCSLFCFRLQSLYRLCSYSIIGLSWSKFNFSKQFPSDIHVNTYIVSFYYY